MGTVISLQCPAKHKLVGSELMCVMVTNSTHWVGETYCKPLSPYEDYGFRVAVLASIVSSAIIFFMSVAFITCCLLDCIKEDKRTDNERESDMRQWEEQAHHREDYRSRYSHKGRNNNNNNTQEKVLSLWDTSAAVCDNTAACRCHQQYAFGAACSYGAAPPLPILPGYDYHRPLLPRNPESTHVFAPPEYNGPPQPYNPDLVQTSGAWPGSAWPYGGQQSTFSGGIPDESSTRNMKPDKECSIRIISV